MKPAERSLSYDARFANFDIKAFKTGERLFYRQGGNWVLGTLNTKLNKRPNGEYVININVRGAPTDIIMSEPPVLVAFKPGEEFRFNGKKYEISAAAPTLDNAGSKILYELTPAPGAAGRDIILSEETLEKIKISRKGERKLDQATEEIKDRMTALLEKIKSIKGEARRDLTDKVNKLIADIKKLNTDLVAARDSGEISKLKDIAKSAEKLLDEGHEAADALDAEIEAAQKKENSEMRTPEQQKEGVAVAKRVEQELKRLKDSKKIQVEALVDAWVLQSETYESEFKRWEKNLTKKQADLQKEKTKRGGGDPAIVTLIEGEISVLEGNLAYGATRPAGRKPREEFDLTEDEKARALAAVWNGLPATPGGLKSAVIKKRQELSVVTTGNADFTPPTSVTDPVGDYVRATAEFLQETMEAWKVPSESKNFDFAKEHRALKSKVQDLEDRAGHLKNKALKDLVKDLKEGKSLVPPPVPAIKLKDLKSATPDAANLLGEFFKQAAEVEADILKAERANKIKGEKSPETKLGTIDIPKQIMLEMMESTPAAVEALRDSMRLAYGVVLEDATPAALTTKVREFIDRIDVNAASASGATTIREQLRLAGIPDWDDFKKHFEKNIVGNYANLMIEMAKNDMDNWIQQEVNTIIGDASMTDAQHARLRQALAGSTFDKLRMLGTAAAIGGASMATTWGARLAGLGLVAEAAAPAVGGAAAGGLRAWFNARFSRKDSTVRERVEKEKERKLDIKKVLVAELLVDRTFNSAGTGVTFRGAGTSLRSQGDLLAYALSTTMRRASEGADNKMIVKDAGGNLIIDLDGDEAMAYREVLEKAIASGESFNESEAEVYKKELALSLHALRNNKTITFSPDTPPALITQIQAGLNAYYGKTSSTVDGFGDEITDTTKHVLNSAAIGGGVTLALAHIPIVGGAVLGSTAGFMHGFHSSHENIRIENHQESLESVDQMAAAIDNLLARGRRLAPGASPGRSLARAEAHEWRDLVDTFLQAKDFSQLKLSTLTDPAHPSRNLITFLQTHAKDVAAFINSNKTYRRILEGTKRELYRSKLLEAQSCKDAIDRLKQTNDRLEKLEMAKNSGWTEFKRSLRRLGRGAVEAVAFGVGAMGVGVGFRQMMETLGVTTPTGEELYDKWGHRNDLPPAAATVAAAHNVAPAGATVSGAALNSAPVPGAVSGVGLNTAPNTAVGSALSNPNIAGGGSGVNLNSGLGNNLMRNLHMTPGAHAGDYTIVAGDKPMEKILSALVMHHEQGSAGGDLFNKDHDLSNVDGGRILNTAQNLLHLKGDDTFEWKGPNHGTLHIKDYGAFVAKHIAGNLDRNDFITDTHGAAQYAGLKSYWADVKDMVGLNDSDVGTGHIKSTWQAAYDRDHAPATAASGGAVTAAPRMAGGSWNNDFGTGGSGVDASSTSGLSAAAESSYSGPARWDHQLTMAPDKTGVKISFWDSAEGQAHGATLDGKFAPRMIKFGDGTDTDFASLSINGNRVQGFFDEQMVRGREVPVFVSPDQTFAISRGALVPIEGGGSATVTPDVVPAASATPASTRAVGEATPRPAAGEASVSEYVTVDGKSVEISADKPVAINEKGTRLEFFDKTINSPITIELPKGYVVDAMGEPKAGLVALHDVNTGKNIIGHFISRPTAFGPGRFPLFVVEKGGAEINLAPSVASTAIRNPDLWN